MEDMIKETLAKGVERHLAGELDLACQLYDAAIKLQPNHADANHNMGLLKLDKGNDLDALLYLQTALQADTSIAQFWLSYINALVKLERRDEAARIISLAKENGMEGEEFLELTRQLDLSLKKIKNTNNEINLTYSNSSKSNDTLEFQELDAAHNLNLSTKGLELIKLYENMVINGYNKVDGSKVTNTYNDFELRKFRNICKHHLQNHIFKQF
jgi:predicted Zn-dependent protease